jgi:hypothetical protein
MTGGVASEEVWGDFIHLSMFSVSGGSSKQQKDGAKYYTFQKKGVTNDVGGFFQ